MFEGKTTVLAEPGAARRHRGAVLMAGLHLYWLMLLDSHSSASGNSLLIVKQRGSS